MSAMTKGSPSGPPIREALSSLLAQALEKSGHGKPAFDPDASFEVPREEKFGDISTNAVFRLAKEKKRPPRPMAEEVARAIEPLIAAGPLNSRIDRVAVEGPGFINFYYSTSEIAGVLLRIHAQGPDFGKPKLKSKNILLEFVSANPTGPLTVAHGRQAALGDSLARILRFAGHRVTTEYYNNDEGVQINTLGQSLFLRVGQILEMKDCPKEMPENYYQGEYLIGIARNFIQEKGEQTLKKLWINPEKPNDAKAVVDLVNECRIYARDHIMEGIKKDLADFDTHFDSYYSQEALGKSGKVEAALDELKKLGVVYESEGAVWLRSSAFGDDKDRVLVKSDKNYTYLTPDIAYHHEKFLRGFDRLIDILGPDHHGYIARLKASQKALGHDPDAVNVLIAQLVTLYEGQKQVRMSTRAGEFVTLRQILDEVGRDAGRFFFLMRKFDAHLDFDLSLAKSQTPENPVFYIQYAHARIESVKNLNRALLSTLPWDDASVAAKLAHPMEQRVMRLLSQFEDSVLGAEKTLEPYRLVSYLMELASAFHRFYAENRIVGDDPALTQARLMLVESVQTVLRSGLGLLGVSAPTKM